MLHANALLRINAKDIQTDPSPIERKSCALPWVQIVRPDSSDGAHLSIYPLCCKHIDGLHNCTNEKKKISSFPHSSLDLTGSASWKGGALIITGIHFPYDLTSLPLFLPYRFFCPLTFCDCLLLHLVDQSAFFSAALHSSLLLIGAASTPRIRHSSPFLFHSSFGTYCY